MGGMTWLLGSTSFKTTSERLFSAVAAIVGVTESPNPSYQQGVFALQCGYDSAGFHSVVNEHSFYVSYSRASQSSMCSVNSL